MDNFDKKNTENPENSKVEESAVEYNTTFNQPQVVSDKEWDEMPDVLKQLLEKGLKESAQGLGTPHDEVMKQIKEKYPFLNGI